MSRITAVLAAGAVLALSVGVFFVGRASMNSRVETARAEQARAEKTLKDTQGQVQTVEQALAYVYRGADEIKKNCRTEFYLGEFQVGIDRCRQFETDMATASEMLGQDEWSLEVD